jgi:hypothetical protein
MASSYIVTDQVLVLLHLTYFQHIIVPTGGFVLLAIQSECLLNTYDSLQIEWLARVNFKHRPMHRNVPNQKQYEVPKKPVFDTSKYIY